MSRMVAFLIDAVIVTISVSILAWTVAITQSLLQLPVLAELLRLGGLFPDFESLLAGFVGTIMFALYTVFFWATTGRTFGKAFMGLRVVTTSGRRLTLPRAMIRLLGYLVSALPLFIGFLWSLIDDRRQGFHDKLAGTCVVYTWAARPDERFLAYQLQRLAPRLDDEE